MFRTVFIKHLSTEDVLLEWFKSAENIHKNPDGLASTVNDLYSTGCAKWSLIEAPLDGVLQVVTTNTEPDPNKVQRYREKLFRTPAPPPILSSNNDSVHVLNGLNVLFALKVAKKERIRLYVSTETRKLLDTKLEALNESRSE
mgnify:FL=1